MQYRRQRSADGSKRHYKKHESTPGSTRPTPRERHQQQRQLKRWMFQLSYKQPTGPTKEPLEDTTNVLWNKKKLAQPLDWRCFRGNNPRK